MVQPLEAVQPLYTQVQYTPTVSGRRGVGIEASCGVKQSCSLTPTLFRLLLH